MPTPSTSAARKRSERPPANRLRTSSSNWPTGPRRTEMRCSANSTVISVERKVQREALFRVAPPGKCIGASFGSGRSFLGSGGPGAISLAHAEAFLRDRIRCPKAQASDRLFHDRPPVLHAQSYLEAKLVSA